MLRLSYGGVVALRERYAKSSFSIVIRLLLLLLLLWLIVVVAVVVSCPAPSKLQNL